MGHFVAGEEMGHFVAGTICRMGRKWDILSSGTICRPKIAGGTICRWDKMSPNHKNQGKNNHQWQEQQKHQQKQQGVEETLGRLF